MLNNVLYADLTGVFLVVGCTLFISLVNCLSEIPWYIVCYQLYTDGSIAVAQVLKGIPVTFIFKVPTETTTYIIIQNNTDLPSSLTRTITIISKATFLIGHPTQLYLN